MNEKWIGVDYVGVLCDAQGAPRKAMVNKVRKWVAAGREVRVLTPLLAPISILRPSAQTHTLELDPHDPESVRGYNAGKEVDLWVRRHIGGPLAITSMVDRGMEVWYTQLGAAK